jgi:hypothetical protein
MMMNTFARMLVLSALGLALAGCEMLAGGIPSRDLKPVPGTTPEAGDGQLRIANASTSDLYFIYVSPTSTDDWGPDQLDDDEILEPGQTLTLTSVGCTEYDIRIEYGEGGDACEVRSTRICGEVEMSFDDAKLSSCGASDASTESESEE